MNSLEEIFCGILIFRFTIFFFFFFFFPSISIVLDIEMRYIQS